MTDTTSLRNLAAVTRMRGMEIKDFYDIGEIAKLLGITVKSVRKLFCKGSIHPLMTSPGRYAGAFAEDLDRYLAGLPMLKRAKAAPTKVEKIPMPIEVPLITPPVVAPKRPTGLPRF